MTEAKSKDRLLNWDVYVTPPIPVVIGIIPQFDHWISVLTELKSVTGYERILTGHDLPRRRPGF